VKVGIVRRQVPVPFGTAMAGYAAREGSSTGVHDPLTVRALVLDDVALVSADVCAIHERTAAQIRSLTADLVQDVVVMATHTHSGPCMAFGRLGPHSAFVHDELVRAAVSAVQEACRSTVECSLAYGRAPGSGVAKNRRHPDRIIDPPIEAFRFRTEGEPVATLITYPCHPVVLDGANRQISSDFPSYLRNAVETDGGLSLWATGCAGDVNTGHSAEASFRDDQSGRRTFAEAERIGNLLAQTLRHGDFRTINTQHVIFKRMAVVLPLSPFDAEQTTRDRQMWTESASSSPPPVAALYRAWVTWADRILALDRQEQTPDGLPPADPEGDTCADGWHGFVCLLDLGGVAIITLPGEPFLAVAEAVKAATDKPVLVLGYADGVPGYLPTADEYRHGGYEVVDAHRYYGMRAAFAPGGAERLIAAAVKLISGNG